MVKGYQNRYIKQRLKHKLNRKEILKGNTRFNTSIP